MKRNKGLIFVVSGPSGSGKTTLVKKLIHHRRLKDRLVRSISCTTRPKRSQEKNGRDYFFITKKQFQEKLRQKKILEWTKYLDYYYATPRDFLERQLEKRKHLILCLDLRGALKVKRLYPKNTTLIFILPPSLAELTKRIRRRCQHTPDEEIKKRLKLARIEMTSQDQFDYCLVNKNLTQAVKDLKDIIVQKIKDYRGE